MTKSEKAVSIFNDGFNCAQAVLTAFCKDFNLDEKTALKISCGFGAGMGRTAQTCGAVSGAIMAIGLKYGRIEIKDTEAREKTYSLTREFLKKFTEENRSVKCMDLLGADISTPEGMEEAKNKKLFTTLCPRLVESAVKIAENSLAIGS